MTDLDLGSGWTPIGATDNGNLFEGTFDGQGYTITYQASTPEFSSSTVLGLFGYFRGTVQHLKVRGSVTNTDESTTNSTAGIVAYNRGTIRECANLASIVGRRSVGGIAGVNKGIITNCYNRGYIGATGEYSGGYHLGGIAGEFEGTELSNVYACCTIEEVSSTGEIVANNISGNYSNCHYAASGTTTLTGNALKSYLNNSKWTFTDGELPELTCFKNKIVRLVDNYDNTAALSCNNGQMCTVELTNRTLYKDGKWNTLCLPFDLTLSGSVLNGDGVVAKVLNGTSTSLDDTGLLSLVFNPAPSTILAGTPFIIKWDNTGGHLTNVRFCDVTLNNAAPTAVTFDNASGASGQFVGTYSPFSIDAGNIDKIVLLSGDNTLGYSKSNRTLRSCRAHFMIPTSSSIRAMMDFDIDFDGGESTRITNMDSTDETDGNDGWWTLTGVKLDGKPTERGIYLHNGRKEAVR